MSEENNRIFVPGNGTPQIIQTDPVTAKSLELQMQTLQSLQVLIRQLDQLIQLQCGHMAPETMRKIFEDFEAKQKKNA